MGDFEGVWARIVASAGEEFHLKRGGPLHYRVDGSWVIPDRTTYRISKRDFAAAWATGRLRGPGDINREARGPSYVYAILTDPRIGGSARP